MLRSLLLPLLPFFLPELFLLLPQRLPHLFHQLMHHDYIRNLVIYIIKAPFNII